MIEKDALHHLSNYFDFGKYSKVLVLSDAGVPSTYINDVISQIKDSYVYLIPQGDESKNLETVSKVYQFMLEKGFARDSLIVNLGGGVVSDLGGYVASTYMRGIDFINIPTTLLSQVDASIGGKVGVNLNSTKNIIGCFSNPKLVIIDVNTLDTLSPRLFNEGMMEAIKMSLTSNRDLYYFIKEHINNLSEVIEEIIYQSLLIKKHFVEEDFDEKGIRKALNFGHTIGHALEVMNKDVYHGEAVLLGMFYASSETVKEELKFILNTLEPDLLSKVQPHNLEILEKVKSDKKMKNNRIQMVFVEEIGSYQFKELTLEEIKTIIEGVEI